MLAGGELAPRRKMAIQVRLGEKRILHAAREEVQDFMKEEVAMSTAGKKEKGKRARDEKNGSGKGAGVAKRSKAS